MVVYKQDGLSNTKVRSGKGQAGHLILKAVRRWGLMLCNLGIEKTLSGLRFPVFSFSSAKFYIQKESFLIP